MSDWTHADWIEGIRLAWEICGGIAVALLAFLNRSLRAAMRVMVTKAELERHRADEHDALERRLAEGDVRFTRIETTLEHLPTRRDIEDLNRHLSKISADLGELSGKVGGLCTQVHQLVQNELEHGK